MVVDSSEEFSPTLLSNISVSIISQFLREVEPIPPAGVSMDSCLYQISVSKEQDTTFVTFKGKNLNSYGDSKLSGTDGFQQSLLKALFRSLRDKRKLICEDYGTLLEECGGVVVQDVPKKVTIPKVEPKVVEIPKKVQEPVVQKTEGDKTVCEKVCEGLVGYFPFDKHFNDVNGNFEKTELIGQDVKFEKRGEEKGVLLNGNNGLLITSNNFDFNQSFTFYALLSIDSISRDWKFEYGNDNNQQNLIRNSSNDFFIKYYFFKDGNSNLKIQYKRKHVWRNKNNPVRKNHSIAISLEDDKNVVNIYMNGYKYQQIKSNYSERSGFSSNEWFLGGKKNNEHHKGGVRGLIYEIRFYNRTLSSKEIRSLSEN